MQLSATAYSFINDPDVPAFEPPEHFTVMDAQCGLCAKGALWIASHDHERKFRIIPMQSELGRALLRHYGMSADDPLSWLYVRAGRAFTSLDAIIRVGQELGGIWKALSVFRALPRSMQDRLYGVVARNRYRFLGRASFCDMPSPEVQERIIR
jgi:predicted DCC family thiol-disulfide oxidoreductase YuxK